MGSDLQQVHILVVEDRLPCATPVVSLLERIGYAVTLAPALSDARQISGEHPPDLMIVGAELLDGGRGEDAGRLAVEQAHFPIIGVSAGRNLPCKVEALQLDASGSLVRPEAKAEDLPFWVEQVLQMPLLKRANSALKEELERKDAYMESLACKDSLTGLYNHAHFHECIERLVKQAARYGRPVSLIFMDVDDFAKVNESFGHQAGDKLLHRLSQFLGGCSRSADLQFHLRTDDIAARYDTDQFAILLPETGKEGAATLAERLRSRVEGHDFGLGSDHRCTVSIGLASFPDDAEDRMGLIRAADVALYCAKAHGRNRMIPYAPELGRSVDSIKGTPGADYLARIVALEHSIADAAFRFIYQPIVEIATRKVCGYEALCRPQHELFDSPSQLFETAQAVGRVQSLGRVLRELAVAPIHTLPGSSLLFVNLHPVELNDPVLLEPEAHSKPWAQRIVFEITELWGIHNYQRAREVMDRLKTLGFRVAVDDLGSGYAGLQSLAFLRPDYVKLDMGLVRGIDSQPRVARLVKHLCEFSEGEGIQMIAEGVENLAECEMMASLGCQMVQGYLFAGPGPPFLDLE